MANTHTSTRQRSPRGSRGVLWMSERQIDAYLQTKEAMRRLRAATASLTTDVRRNASPSASAT